MLDRGLLKGEEFTEVNDEDEDVSRFVMRLPLWTLDFAGEDDGVLLMKGFLISSDIIWFKQARVGRDILSESGVLWKSCEEERSSSSALITHYV